MLTQWPERPIRHVQLSGQKLRHEVRQPPILYAARDGHREAIKLLAQYEAGTVPRRRSCWVAQSGCVDLTAGETMNVNVQGDQSDSRCLGRDESQKLA